MADSRELGEGQGDKRLSHTAEIGSIQPTLRATLKFLHHAWRGLISRQTAPGSQPTFVLESSGIAAYVRRSSDELRPRTRPHTRRRSSDPVRR